MKLRPKLVLTLAAVVIPTMLLFSVFRIYAEQRAIQERFANRIISRVEARAGRRCERDPAAFEIRRRGFQVYAYDERFRAANPQAPAFDADLRQALAGDEEAASRRLWRHEGHSGVTAMRTEWASQQCAVLAVYWPDRIMRRRGPMVARVATEVGVLALVLLVTGVIVGGPLVGRIRRLTAAIEEADTSDYRVEAEADAGDEIGELARAFNRAGERVEASVAELEARDRTLTEYIANTTHDLAIPLTVLQHRLRRLQKQLGDDSTGELADAAMQEAHYIASLIANMGAAARLEGRGQKLTLHECSLGEIVERVVSRHRPLAEQDGVELNWATPPDARPVDCDSTLVEQALSNLVQNAIQYNAVGGHVSVIFEQADRGFELRVVDDGPGLADELLEEVTDRSFRGGDARTRRPDGQGFGLSIAHKICALHGWQLELQNRDEGGLEATVTARSAHPS